MFLLIIYSEYTKIIFGGKIQIFRFFACVIFQPFYFNISPFLPAFPAWKMKMRRRRRLLLLHTHREKSPFCFLGSALSLKEGRQQSFHFPACLPKVITHIKDEVYRPNCLKDILPHHPQGLKITKKPLIFTTQNLKKIFFK